MQHFSGLCLLVIGIIDGGHIVWQLARHSHDTGCEQQYVLSRRGFVVNLIVRPWRQLFMLKAGIVGLPNVGKSTLFNAVTRTHKAPAENYPFCTIEPNVGVVTVPDAAARTARQNRQDHRHHPGGD